MRKMRIITLTFLSAVILTTFFASQARASLESGVPFQTWVNSMSFTNIDILVPEGATRLTVSISNGSGDLDLYLKYGSPVSGSTIAEIDADADILSDGPSADETISITPTTTPALRAGTWYVATLNLNDETTSFTITATIEKAANPVDLGSVVVGQTTQKSIEISNPGTADLIVTSVGVTGTDLTMFSTTHNCITVRPTETCIVSITFSPTSSGVKSAQLNLYSNDPDTPTLTIPLIGTGIADPVGDVLPLPTGKTNYPAYSPTVSAATGINPATCKPIGVGDLAADGETVSVEIKLEKPSGPYDAYLALQAPALDPNEFFMLGQDGIFHPLSQSGLVKWKQASTGNIDEKPFGDFPVSLLPGGTYNFNFMLTPAGSRDAYYLWETSFFAPDPSLNVPDGSAGLFNGTLVVPNATIIYQGQEYQGSAPIPPDSLVGIVRDEKTYLYHTSLGQVVVSDETTRRAVGHFVMGSATRMTQPQSIRSGFAPNSDNILKVSTSKRLRTGIELQRLANKVIKANNNQRRWAAVKGTDGSGPYFIPPVSRYVDDNLLLMLGSELQWSQDWFNASNIHEKIFYPESDSLIIETYAAAWSPLAYFLEGCTNIGDAVYYYFMGQSPPSPIAIPIDGLDLRNQKDAALGIALDRIDLAHMLMDGVRNFYAAADVTEGGEIFVNMCCNLATSMVHTWYCGEAGSSNASASFRAFIVDAAGDLTNIGIVLCGGMPFTTLVDVIAAFNYIIEGAVIHDTDVLGRWAYDEIRVEPEDINVIGSWYWCDDKNCSHAYEPGEGRQNMLLYGSERNNEASVDGFGDGKWTLQGPILKVVVTNIDDRTYTFEGKVDGGEITDGIFKETSNFPVDKINHCWFATKYR